jgi:regulator of protease activity HflC (stomatin/prohibitin superfamily)
MSTSTTPTTPQTEYHLTHGTDTDGESVGGTPAGHPVGREGARVEVQERKAWYVDGILAVVVALVLTGLGAWLLANMGFALEDGTGNPVLTGVIGGLLVLAAAVLFSGLTIISPGDTNVVQFFGRYVGTIRKAGLLMTVPFTTKKNVSVKVRNFETSELKVNDADGNPVNIAAIIVWQVADTAKSVFAVEAYDTFVAVQAESALRHVATSHPYDNAAPGEETLRGSTGAVADELAEEVAARIAIAGLEVVETRISSLAYAPEIAQAMLQRQQASAIIAAREKIVEGAVSMVQNALDRLEDESIVKLDEERRAAMVSNLLVVLTSDSRVSPVINTGSLSA